MNVHRRSLTSMPDSREIFPHWVLFVRDYDWYDWNRVNDWCNCTFGSDNWFFDGHYTRSYCARSYLPDSHSEYKGVGIYGYFLFEKESHKALFILKWGHDNMRPQLEVIHE